MASRVFSFWILGSCLLTVAAGSVLPVTPACAEEKNADTSPPEESQEWRGWYLTLGSSLSFPGLDDAEEQIDQEINEKLRLLAPGFDDVKTFADQRDELMIWMPFVSVGYRLTSRWSMFAQVGYTAGSVRTEADDISLFLLPLHSDVKLERSTFMAGIGAQFYPWGVPESREFHSIGERLKAARPFIGGALNWNRFTADGRVYAGLKPFPNFIHQTDHQVWEVWNIGPDIGIEIPLDETSCYSINVTYNAYFDYQDDFNGPSVGFMWQKKF